MAKPGIFGLSWPVAGGIVVAVGGVVYFVKKKKASSTTSAASSKAQQTTAEIALPGGVAYQGPSWGVREVLDSAPVSVATEGGGSYEGPAGGLGAILGLLAPQPTATATTGTGTGTGTGSGGGGTTTAPTTTPTSPTTPASPTSGASTSPYLTSPLGAQPGGPAEQAMFEGTEEVGGNPYNTYDIGSDSVQQFLQLAYPGQNVTSLAAVSGSQQGDLVSVPVYGGYEGALPTTDVVANPTYAPSPAPAAAAS